MDKKITYYNDKTSLTKTAWFHVDMDGLDVIFQGFGKKYSGGVDEFYITAVENSLSFFKKKNITATYFLIAKDLNEPGKLSSIKKIVKCGHKIACHGYNHRSLTSLSSKEKYLEIVEAKERIEEALGIKCLGFRAPRYHIDLESFDLMSETGYKYDTSIYPNHKYHEWFPEAHIQKEPFLLFKEKSFYEVPLPYVIPMLPPFHASYIFYLRSFYFKTVLYFFRQYSNCLTYLFHLTDFATPHNIKCGLKLNIFTNNFYSKSTKLNFLEKLTDHISHHFLITTTEDYLEHLSG